MNKLFFVFLLSVNPLFCDVGKAHANAVHDSNVEFAWAAGAVSLATISIMVGIVASSVNKDANGQWVFPHSGIPYTPPYVR